MEARWKHWRNSRQLSTNRSSAGGHLVVSQRRTLNNKLAKFKDFGFLWTCSQNFLSQISNENHMCKWAVLLKIWHIYIKFFTPWSFLFLLLSSLICYKWSYPLTCWHSFCGQYLVYAVSVCAVCRGTICSWCSVWSRTGTAKLSLCLCPTGELPVSIYEWTGHIWMDFSI